MAQAGNAVTAHPEAARGRKTSRAGAAPGRTAPGHNYCGILDLIQLEKSMSAVLRSFGKIVSQAETPR
mgnify:CR=1 FL=1